MPFYKFLDRGASFDPQAVCLQQGTAQWTYAQVQQASYLLADKLRSLGLGPGHHASVLSKNDANAFMCLFGINRAGLAWVPANPRLNQQDNQYLLDQFDCQVLLFHSAFESMVRQLVKTTPKLKHLVCIDRALEGIVSLQEWTANASPSTESYASQPDTLVMLAPTGGTTGKSKGVMLTERNLLAYQAGFMVSLAYDQAVRPVNLAAAPLTHAAGLCTFPVIARGGKVVVLESPEPASMLAALASSGATETFLPPTAIYRLLSHPDLAKYDYSQLKYFVYAAAPMSVEKLKQAIAAFGPCMTQVFGQTEAPMICTFLSPKEHMQGSALAPDQTLSSCGRPTPLVDISIQDELGQQLPHGQQGEICVKGDLVMAGYYKQPELTAQTIIDGWLHTGDVGYIDADGRVHICDRKKDMIISGGYNIYPQEIEQLIWAHPAVEDCAVIGVADEDWGEAVKAVVELKANARVTAEELMALCKHELGSLKTPKSVDFVDSLPRSVNGKVLKKDVRELYA